MQAIELWQAIVDDIAATGEGRIAMEVYSHLGKKKEDEDKKEDAFFVIYEYVVLSSRNPISLLPFFYLSNGGLWKRAITDRLLGTACLQAKKTEMHAVRSRAT